MGRNPSFSHQFMALAAVLLTKPPILASFSALTAREKLHLLVDLEVLGGVSPLGGQDVTPGAGQRIPDQEVSVTLHQVLRDLQQHMGSHISTRAHTHTRARAWSLFPL